MANVGIQRPKVQPIYHYHLYQSSSCPADFLPHLPSLEIREGAIDRLVRLYKDAVYKTGGFLTKSGIVNPNRVQIIMQGGGDSSELQPEKWPQYMYTELGISSETMFCCLRFGVFRHCAHGGLPILQGFRLPKQNRKDRAISRK